MEFLHTLELNETRFLGLLDKLIGESKFLQNNPAQGLIPREDSASDHVIELLSQYSTENGGVLEIKRVSFLEGRGNLIIKYPGKTSKICSFVGSHLDVVPANPDGWDRDPFKLIIEGDTLYGRGTTDCLGHVALLADLMASLGEQRPALDTSIVVVFIANEECSSFPGVGVDQLEKEGYMDELKNGPLFWIDSADSQPCVGTAGMLTWKLDVFGKLFHSGLPHKGINSIEFAFDVVSSIQKKFYEDFPKHEKETRYNYSTSSTLKPTQISCAPGSLNQIPPSCTVEGDIRLTPFYDIRDVKAAVEGYVAEINSDPTLIESHGPFSHYSLPDEGRKGRVELTWIGNGENGIACNLDSIGYHALYSATEQVLGTIKPYAIGGSLPLIRDLQDKGFDCMISGYGLSSKYHADNECASLKDLKTAAMIIAKVVAILESS